MPSGATTIIYSGVNGRAGAVFDGVDDFVDTTLTSNDVFTNGFTINCWIKPNAAGESNTGRILDKGTGEFGIAGFAYYTGNTNKVIVRSDIGNLSSTSNIIFADRVWYNVSLTITTGDVVTHYLNGATNGSSTIAGFLANITNTNALRIGNLVGATTRSYDGAISDVKIWNRVLTSAELVKVAADQAVTDGLTHNWKLDTDYTDSVGTADGTNTGTRLAIVDDKLAQQVANLRVNKNDKWFMSTQGKQLAITHIEEVT